jgi:N-formylglutamate amidohydrolase
MPDSLPPFRRLGPETPHSPVVLSVPHAGRDYSPGLLAAARLSRARLEAWRTGSSTGWSGAPWTPGRSL